MKANPDIKKSMIALEDENFAKQQIKQKMVLKDPKQILFSEKTIFNENMFIRISKAKFHNIQKP